MTRHTAQFPTAVRYGSMGVSYNIAVAVFGGTSPLIIESLLQATGNSLTPAWYLVGAALVGAVAVAFLRESAGRPLPGSMPAVESSDEAERLVATQEENPHLDLEALPLGGVCGRGRNPTPTAAETAPFEKL